MVIIISSSILSKNAIQRNNGGVAAKLEPTPTSEPCRMDEMWVGT